MKPVPVPQPESDFYWQKARAHELWVRRCIDCTRAYFYPRDICPHCFSRSTEWIRASGRGVLHSFAIVHRPPTPDFRDAVPYVTALVELEEGVRMPTNLVGIEPDPAKIRIGMAVKVLFEAVAPEISLPIFEPA